MNYISIFLKLFDNKIKENQNKSKAKARLNKKTKIM